MSDNRIELDLPTDIFDEVVLPEGEYAEGMSYSYMTLGGGPTDAEFLSEHGWFWEFEWL